MTGTSVIGAVRKAMRLPPADVQALAEAVLALLVARLRFSARPVRDLLADLQADARQRAAPVASAETDPRLHRLAWAVATAARHVPWRADCLIQVLAADRLLRRRGRTPHFHLGVSRSETGDMTAHAWIVCDGVTVSGGDSAHFHVLLGPAADRES